MVRQRHRRRRIGAGRPQHGSKVAYSALGQLPPTQRSTYEGWLANGGIDQVAAVLPGWTAGSGLAADLFHDTFFGPHESRTVSGSAQQVGAALAAGGAEATRTAGQHFADLVKIARPEAMARTMAGAVTKAKTPAALGLVQQAAARQAARPAPSASTAHAPVKPKPPHKAQLSPEEKRREQNIEDMVRVIYNEARGDGHVAMVVVGHTLRNRMLRNGVKTVHEVWRGYDHSAPAPKRDEPGNIAALAAAKKLAADILDGKVPDPTDGATNYYSPKRMPKDKESTANRDVAGGLETVPGITDGAGNPVMSYRPGWSIDPQFKPISVPGIQDRDYKLFRKEGTGHVR